MLNITNENKERLQKKKRHVKGIKTYPKPKKIKSNNVFVNNIKVSPKMKNEGWLSTEKHIIK